MAAVEAANSAFGGDGVVKAANPAAAAAVEAANPAAATLAAAGGVDCGVGGLCNAAVLYAAA